MLFIWRAPNKRCSCTLMIWTWMTSQIKSLFRTKCQIRIFPLKWNRELCWIIERKFNSSTTPLLNRISQLKSCWSLIKIWEFAGENIRSNFLISGKSHFNLIWMEGGKTERHSLRKLWIFWTGRMVLLRPFTNLWRIDIFEVLRTGMESEN